MAKGTTLVMTVFCARLGGSIAAPSHGPRLFSGLARRTPEARPWRSLALACILPLLVVAARAQEPGGAGASPAMTQAAGVGEPITPVPLWADLDANKVALGRRLFNDSRLSSGNGVSCNSCHLINEGMTDHLPVSRGLPGYPGITNTLGLFNVGLNSKFSWSGRLATLEDHTDQVIQSKRTMGGQWEEVLVTLRRDPSVVAAFEAIYPDGIQRSNVIDAIVALELSFNTPNSPFDRYLRGEKDAISPETKAGYQLFKDYGCVSCHQGVNVGGNMLQAFGIFERPNGAKDNQETPGSALDTGITGYGPVFRVPSLRNVAHTAPYFHDGSVATLREAIDTMARTQLGRNLAQDDAAKLEAFLRSLTGEFQGVSLDKR